MRAIEIAEEVIRSDPETLQKVLIQEMADGVDTILIKPAGVTWSEFRAMQANYGAIGPHV